MRSRTLAAYAVVLACFTSVSRAAGAQTGSTDRSLARYTVGGAIGTAWSPGGPLALVSIQAPLSRYAAAEFEATRTAYDDLTVSRSSYPGYIAELTHRESGRTLTFAGNLTLRAGTRHVVGFVGGGLGFVSIRTTRHYSSSCTPLPGSKCAFGTYQEALDWNRSDKSLQFLGGVDVPLGAVIPFVAVRYATANEGEVRALAGLRLALHTPVIAAPPPQHTASNNAEVRVWLSDGTRRTVRFTALSTDALTFTELGRPVVVPLSQVRSVERVSHAAAKGTLIGTLIGAALLAVAYTGDCADCEDRRSAFLIPPIGAAAGAGIGALITATSKRERTIYPSIQP